MIFHLLEELHRLKIFFSLTTDQKSKTLYPIDIFPIGKRASPKFQVVVSFSDFTLVDDRPTPLHTVHQKIGVTFEMYSAAEQAMRVIFDG